jgi:hypothetical protein
MKLAIRLCICGIESDQHAIEVQRCASRWRVVVEVGVDSRRWRCLGAWDIGLRQTRRDQSCYHAYLHRINERSAHLNSLDSISSPTSRCKLMLHAQFRFRRGSKVALDSRRQREHDVALGRAFRAVALPTATECLRLQTI